MNLTRPLLAMVAGAVVLASCATAPKPAPATTTAPAATTTTTAPQKSIPADLQAELTKAKQMKAEIDQNLPAGELPAAYQEGSTALSAGEQALGTDNATAKTQLDLAIADFQKVIDQGQALYQARQQKVASAKQAALAAKADRAVPDQWNQAQSLDQQAAQKESTGDYLAAYGLLGQSIDAYNQATTQAKELQAQAQQALNDAGTQITQTKSQIETLQQGLKSDEAQTKAAGGGGQ